MPSVNPNILKNFLQNDLHITKLDNNQAQKYDIDKDTFEEVDIDENSYLDVDEILDNDELYAQFATMYEDEMKKDNSLDKEKEKQKNEKVQNTGGAGI